MFIKATNLGKGLLDVVLELGDDDDDDEVEEEDGDDEGKDEDEADG